MTTRKQFWGGFVSGKLYLHQVNDAYGTTFMPALFYNKREAKERYQDVRKITVSNDGKSE